MPQSDAIRHGAERRRKRRNSLFAVLAAGLALFAIASVGLYFLLKPTTFRIAVGPAGSDDQKLVQAMAEAFDRDRSAIRLSPIITTGPTESLALLGNQKSDLAVARGDLEMPKNAELVAIMRRDFAILWAPSGLTRKTKAQTIKALDQLEGRRVGIVGRTPANAGLLTAILTASGIAADKVAVKQFATTELEEMARDQSVDVFMAIGPMESKVTRDAIAATARLRGGPQFLPIDVSEAIAEQHPVYQSEEIPGSIISSNPAWPPDKLETISVSHLIVASRTLSEARVGALTRQVLSIRHSLARELPGAALIKKPDTDKDAALPVHRGASAYVDGNERTFLDRYSDYIWFVLLVASGIGSAVAWLRKFFMRDAWEQRIEIRNTIHDITTRARSASTSDDIREIDQTVDALLSRMIACHEAGALDDEDMAALDLPLQQMHHVIAMMRSAQSAPVPRAAIPEGIRGIRQG